MAMVESAREVCGSVRVGGGSPKRVWWNDQVKSAVKRKEDVYRRCWELEMKVKRYIYQSKQEVQEQFGRKMNQDVNGNRKLF